MNLQQKLDMLEGEIGIMKGEIKQTLVDLREFIMKQGAPFVVDGAAAPDGARQAAPGATADPPPSDEPEEEPGISPDEMERMLEDARESARQEAAAELHEEMEAMRADQAPQIMPDPFQASGLGSPQPPPQVVQIHQEPSPEVASNAVSEGLAPPDEGFQIVSQAAGDPPVSTAMDSNLVTNLMRWVGDVKRRMGASQFEGFLEVYKLTGHLPPVVEKVILQLATLDALPDESADQVFTLDDLMDSLLQLHAIIYGPGYASRGSLENLLEGNGEGSHLDG